MNVCSTSCEALRTPRLPKDDGLEIKELGKRSENGILTATAKRPDRAAASQGSAGVDLIQKALGIIGSPEKLAEWVQTSMPALRGRTPFSLLDAEDRMEHGVY
jgi:antitoxin Xre/MbcA/ParS-like protein